MINSNLKQLKFQEFFFENQISTNLVLIIILYTKSVLNNFILIKRNVYVFIIKKITLNLFNITHYEVVS